MQLPPLGCSNHNMIPDVIPNKILKVFAYELAPVIIDIYNASVKQGVFPSILKCSIVVPFLKLRCLRRWKNI